jgi:hypothetical protein
MRMRILAPIERIIGKLVSNRFAKLNEKGSPIATARKDLVNLSHKEIVNFYNHRIRGVLNFYSFAGNYNSLRGILMFLSQSCALTLALKYKIRTKGRAYTKFGLALACPETGAELIRAKTLKVRHDFKNRDIDEGTLDQSLSESWYKKLSQSNFGKQCAICGSTEEL